MLSLNLSARSQVKLPASAFPQSADIYICNKCGQDITNQLHPPRPHSLPPIAPENYRCKCGEKYATGAIEWDHLSDWQKTNRLRGVFLFGIFVSVMSIIISGPIYLVLRYDFHVARAALVVAWLITVFPFCAISIPFLLDLAASVSRTRSATNVSSGKN
jgi:hypothetical protein